MVYDSKMKGKTTYYNRSNISSCHIYVGVKPDGAKLMGRLDIKKMSEIPWTKYQIKETDMRVKTANFTTPTKLDLTQGVLAVKIVSSKHESFTGELLKNDHTENSDGTYTYQCQDMSREFQSKWESITNGISNYRILQTLLTAGLIGLNIKIDKNVKRDCKVPWSGLRPLDMYQGSLWGNPVKTNMLAQKPKLVIRNKTIMETIRAIALACGYTDVYFNGEGILQIEPISLDDWQHTGLVLSDENISSKKFTFDITNVITGVTVQATDNKKTGTAYGSKTLTGLNLSAFFGRVYDTISNPVQNTSNKSSAKGTNKAKSTSKTKTKNAWGNKKKKVWIGADGGSGSFCKEIISELNKKGWSCHYSGANSEVHYWDVFNVSSDYQVLAIVDNGFDPVCIKEIYDNGTCKSTLAKKNVEYCFIFDSRDWTNPNGNGPYRYGNFKGANFGKAWDDGYSSWNGRMDAEKYFRSHNVKYCCSPSAKTIAEQFDAGGYYKWKGI